MGHSPGLEYILTLIVPLFNEEGNLPRLVRELSEYLSATSYKTKVLLVNDGSTDGSQKLIEEYCAASDAFNFITLQNNGGLSTALKAGIDQVETRFTGYMDADLQTTPFDIDLLMEYAELYELVSGIRVGRQDGLIKRMTSKIANAIRRAVTHDGAEDTGCPLKVFHTEVARRIPFFKGMHRFLPALVQLGGGKVKMVPVRHFKRLAGQSNFRLLNRLVGPAVDLIAFIWMRKRAIRYKIVAKG